MIDVHQHFWRLSRGDYAWPNESVGPIFRDFGPDDLTPLMERSGVRATILVQATDTVAETEFLLETARSCRNVVGVVGWVDLSSPDAIATMDHLRADPLLKGFRPMLQNIEDTDWILRAEVQPALAHMAAVGLRFDALIQPRHLPATLAVASTHPSLRIVIDHLAKPKMGDSQAPEVDWVRGIEALAACPNVWCKLSGMVTEIGPHWRQDDLEPFASTVLFAFGSERTMWGSDWPVVNLAADYERWVESAQSLAAGLDDAQRERLFEGSARAFYGLAKVADDTQETERTGRC